MIYISYCWSKVWDTLEKKSSMWHILMVARVLRHRFRYQQVFSSLQLISSSHSCVPGHASWDVSTVSGSSKGQPPLWPRSRGVPPGWQRGSRAGQTPRAGPGSTLLLHSLGMSWNGGPGQGWGGRGPWARLSGAVNAYVPWYIDALCFQGFFINKCHEECHTVTCHTEQDFNVTQIITRSYKALYLSLRSYYSLGKRMLGVCTDEAISVW